MTIGPDSTVAIILGVLFTIRKLDAQRRSNKEFSHVKPEDFEDWQRQEVSTFSLAMFACFGKFFLDLSLVNYFSSYLPARAVPLLGIGIFVSWLGVMVLTFFRTRRLTMVRTQLRIILGGFIVESGSQLSQELKAGLRTMEEGDLERAQYQINQVVLDGDDSLKAIALYWLGECYLRQSKTDAARDAFHESLDVDPSLQQPQDALNRLQSET